MYCLDAYTRSRLNRRPVSWLAMLGTAMLLGALSPGPTVATLRALI